MKNTTWLLLTAAVLAFTMVCWTNYLQGRLEEVLRTLQKTEFLLNEFEKFHIRDQIQIKQLLLQQQQQLEKK